jgi:hypothetical protein
MKIMGVRVWPWYLMGGFVRIVRWQFIRNREGGLSVTINRRLFYTSDRAEARRERPL